MKEKRAAIYVRVSTGEQDTAMQEAELKEHAECRGFESKVYRDHAQSGAKTNRPGLDQLLGDVRSGRVSVVMVWSLDRLARSLRQLLDLAEEFHSLDVALYSHKQAIDTQSAAGRLTYQLLASVSEFERELLRERVRAGIAQARRTGKKLGRPPLRRFDADEVSEIKTLSQKGTSVRRLAIQFKTTQYIVAKVLALRQVPNKHSILGAPE